MSVLKNERKESKMQVQSNAIEIAAYTFQKASNEKIIPKRYRWSVGEKMQNAALDLCDHIDIANSLSLDNEEEANERNFNQRLALADTFRLMTMINMANRIKSNLDCYEYWTKLVIDEQALLRGWIDSDKKRRKSMT